MRHINSSYEAYFYIDSFMFDHSVESFLYPKMHQGVIVSPVNERFLLALLCRNSCQRFYLIFIKSEDFF